MTATPDEPNPQRLAEIAALAVAHDRADAALRIFAALATAQPQCRAARRGRAIALACNGRYREAAELFSRHVLPDAPDDRLARCFYALSLARSGRHGDGATLLAEFADGNDSACRAMAREQLGWADAKAAS